MIGLYVLFLVVVWFVVVCVIVTVSVRKLPLGRWRAPVGLLAGAILFPLPMIDEIVGGIQFKRLCEDNAAIWVDRKSARGRVVFRADIPRQQIKGTWIPVVKTEWQFVDVKSGETVVSYSTFDAGPGFFRISGGPLLFRGYCAPGGHVNPRQLLDDLGVRRVERPTVEGGK